ncbi:MAG: hypothetical protein SOY54_00275 [Bacilli bacterium]|nr:hypothetical protein [Bacilli bacterium]
MDSINMPTWLTPSFVATGLTILSIVVILIGFLIGFIRGTYRASYRFIVSIVVILGLWLIMPIFTNKLLSLDLHKFNLEIINVMGYKSVEGFQVNSVKDAVDIYSRVLLGLTTENEGVLILKETNINIGETMIYQTLISAVEMLLRAALLLVIIILNWTLFRFIFFIVYLCTKPKRENKYQKKKTMKSRLIGSLIGTVNMICILLIVCIPLSGVFSLAESSVKLIETEESDVIKLSLNKEVIDLDENPDFVEFANENKEWVYVYRKTFLGKIFGIKVSKDTPLDCALFDGIFSFKAGGEKIALRKELDVCLKAMEPLKDEIIIPLIKNENTATILDNLSSDTIKNSLDKLSELKLVNAVVNVGLNTGIIIAKNDGEIFKEYVNLKDILLRLEGKEINASELLREIGDLSEAILTLTKSSGYKISELLSEDNGNTVSKLVDILLKVDTNVVTNVFDAISKIELIDLIQEITFPTLEDYLNNNENLNRIILLYPKVTLDENYLVINGIKTNILWDKDTLENISFKVSKDNKWIVDGKETNLDASGSIFKIKLDGIKLTDEVKNIGSLYKAFKDLDINSFSQIQLLIEKGQVEGSYDLEKATYDKIDNLFKSLLDFKIISNCKDNIYAILNNMLPNEYRNLLSRCKFDSEDLASLVYAGKVVASTGVIWDIDGKLKTDGNIDYTKVYTIFNSIKDELSENLAKSSIIVENINTVASYALSVFAPDMKLDFASVDWKNNGKEELNKLFNVLNVCLKHGNKITSDFYGLTDEEIDEIANVLKENIATSDLLKKNMNNIVSVVSNLESLKELNATIAPLDEDEWTTEELDSIFDSVKIIVKMVKASSGDQNNLLVTLLKLNENDINTILDSKFISLNIVYNLCAQASEGGLLYEKVIINLDRDDPSWYGDEGELKTILSNAIKLIDGVDNLENTDETVEKIVKNISKLNSNFKKENDDIGKLLSSSVISDTLIYYLENLDKFLGEEISDMIVIPEDINWKDTTEEGELRKILVAAKDVLVDENGEVIINDLKTGDEKQIIKVLLKINDEKIDQVLDSKIILKTAVKFIEKYSKEENKLQIFLQNKTRDDAYWQSQMKTVLKGLKDILLDSEGNVISFELQGEEYIEIISKLKEESINKLLDSEILVDTIAHLIINMADQENSLFVVRNDFRETDEKWSSTQTDIWRNEINKIITSVKSLLIKENPDGTYTNNFKVFTEGTAEEQINLLLDVKDEDIIKITDSVIIVDSISKVLIDMSNEENAVIKISDEVKGYDIQSWKVEIQKLIASIKELLIDENGEKQTAKLLNGNQDDIIMILVNLGEDESKIRKIIDSEIVYQTLTSSVKELGEGEEKVIYLPSDIDSWAKDDWINEVKGIIYASNKLFIEGEGEQKKVNFDKLNGDTNTLLQTIVDLYDDTNENDDLSKVLQSLIIVKTISEQIIKLSKENDMINTNGVISYSLDEWKVEIRALVASSKLVFADETGKIDINNISNDINKLLNNICNLENNPYSENDEVGKILKSRILVDTMIDKINEQSAEGVLVIPSDVIWKDTYQNENIIEGELRKIFRSLSVMFKGNVDIQKLDANIVINLTDSEVDEVLSSKVISKTVDQKLHDLSNENEDIVCGEIDDLNTEVKALIKAARIILTNESGEVDLVNPQFDIEKIMHLTDAEQNDLLSSQIIVDSIKNKLIKMNDTTILVVNQKGISDWKQELKNVLVILNQENKILSADENGKYLVTPKVDMKNIYNLDDKQISEILASKIIVDTIVIKLCDMEELNTSNIVSEITKPYPNFNSLSKEEQNQIITSSPIWYDGEELGEVHKLFLAAKSVTKNGEVNINQLKSLDDKELDTVFASQIILDTFYKKVEEINELEIKEGTVKDKNEAKRFVRSIQVVLGETDITSVSATQFNFDNFIVLNDEQIETLLDSQIIRYSASKKTYEILNDGALKDYINLSGNESEDVDLVSSDLPNLLKVIRDLNEKGIKYTEFTFDKFKEKIRDDVTKADEISDILLTSQIICNSLSKMIGKVLDGALGVDSDMRKAVNLDIETKDWLDNPETKEIGEFKKIFRLLTCIDQFANDTIDNKNITDASLIATPLKRINDSMVLRGIIPMFVEKTTANVDAWKYSSGDNMYKDPYKFTKEEWDQEIDNISTTISLVNANSLTLDRIDVKETDLKVLKMILKEVAKSRILNIACIEKTVKEGVDNTFFGGKDTVTVAKVYDGTNYDEKILAWNGNEENQGEIDKLINALEVLKTIKSTEINGTADGQANAKVIGSFLDKCKESKMLRSVIVTIVNEIYKDSLSKIGITVTESSLQGINFETSLPLAALFM